MNHLIGAYRKLLAGFPLTWLDPLATTLAPGDDIVQQKSIDAEIFVLTHLDSIAGGFFEEINLSIIEGEYAKDLTVANQQLDSMETLLTGIAANIDFQGYNNITTATQRVFTDAFFHSVRRSIIKYRLLIDFVFRHINYKPGISFIFHQLESETDILRSVPSTANTESELFELNMDLAKVDHSISLKQETIKDLLLLKHRLSLLNSSVLIVEILKLKCKFLLYKLSFRLQQSNTKYHYAIDFHYASVSHVLVAEFQSFNDIIAGHYDVGINPTNFDLRSENALDEFQKQAPVLDLDHFHALTKYFKDDAKNIAKLQKLKGLYSDFYGAKIQQRISDFDKKAYEIAFCYIENNLLSLELDSSLFTIENWENKFREYTDRAELSNNSNFFPYFKIIDKFLVPEIKRQFEQSAEDFDVIDSLIKSFGANLNKLLKNIAICDETDYLPFQSDFQHSFAALDVRSTLHQCFVSSSFALPLDFSTYREMGEEYKVELTKYKTLLDNQRLLRKDREIIQDVKAEMARTDKRHIEILSIFSALVMFVSNEIQIFTKVTDMADAVAYTLFFAYSLGLFVVLIWFVTRAEGLKKGNYSKMTFLIPILFLFGLCAAVVYIFIKQPKADSNRKKLADQNFKIDSLTKAFVIDSLKSAKSHHDSTALLRQSIKNIQ